MQENAELWKKLCDQVAVEKDWEKLRELTSEVYRELLEREERKIAEEAEGEQARH